MPFYALGAFSGLTEQFYGCINVGSRFQRAVKRYKALQDKLKIPGGCGLHQLDRSADPALWSSVHPVWKSTSELGYIDQVMGRPKFDFHTVPDGLDLGGIIQHDDGAPLLRRLEARLLLCTSSAPQAALNTTAAPRLRPGLSRWLSGSGPLRHELPYFFIRPEVAVLLELGQRWQYELRLPSIVKQSDGVPSPRSRPVLI